MMSIIWLWLLTATLALYLLRRLALPKPVPGIPYDHKAANRVLGNLPDIFVHIRETGEVASFFSKRASRQFKTPIFQLFMRPFGRPWVIVTDFRESQDIVVRRTQEFDRSDFFADVFSTIVPGSMVHMSTNEVWKGQRKLMADTMTPSFLESTSAPSIYSSAEILVNLWKEKTRLAKGHAFEVKADLHRSALDTIWTVAFGTQIGVTSGQLELLSATEEVPLADDIDKPVAVPLVEEPAVYKSISHLTESLGIPMSSAVPRWHHWLAVNVIPSLVKARRHKDQLIEERIDQAVLKFSSKSATDGDVKCALDHVIQREIQRAAKDNRDPDPKSYLIRDELFTFIVAGHDTSAATLAWGLKLLTDNLEVQDKLRQHLYDAYKDALENRSTPTAKDICKSKIPYLEATLEEIYRLSGTSSATFRKTTTDAVVLGHVIPKGTDVYLATFGPDFVSPALHVDESARSLSSQESKHKSGSWDPDTVHHFQPERWLKIDAAGVAEFDPRAGPSMLFGGGMRGCFGRRLAELQIKLQITLIVWSFHLESTPLSLSSYKAIDGMTHTPRQCYLRLRETHPA